MLTEVNIILKIWAPPPSDLSYIDDQLKNGIANGDASVLLLVIIYMHNFSL